MARKLDFIKDISEKKELWKLPVKVVSIWTTKKGQYEQFEMVLRDVKGDTILAIIPPEEVKNRKSDLEQLLKMTTQIIKNFRVQKNDVKYKFSDHPYKLCFIPGTSIEVGYKPEKPIPGFFFKNLAYIKPGNFREDLLVDVIGAVHSIGSAQTTAGSGKLNINFSIKDLSGCVMDCCLWESLAAQLIAFLKNRTGFGPIIVIVKHARLKNLIITLFKLQMLGMEPFY